MSEPWSVILASRFGMQHPRPVSDLSFPRRSQLASSAQAVLSDTLQRAATVSSLERVAAVFALPPSGWRDGVLGNIASGNLLVQPEHKGTAYEVLFALLMLEKRVSSATTVVFFPPDYVVNDENVMSNALLGIAEWVNDEPQSVFLLGAVPQGPHNELGYIVPWHGAMLAPTSVYEFVERPDIHRARQLINAGGLWNTFIFGGTFSALVKLFQPRFDATITAVRAALQTVRTELDLIEIYAKLSCIDFSQEVLAKQSHQLQVLRLARCEWWPMKSPSS